MIDIKHILQIAQHGGEIVLGMDWQGCNLDNDAYNRLLANACLLARSHVVRELRSLTPGIPVWSQGIGEVDEKLCNDSKKTWSVILSTPTETQIRNNTNLTIEIALIDEGVPSLGLVHAPFQKTTYWGAPDLGAFKTAAQDDTSVDTLSSSVSDVLNNGGGESITAANMVNSTRLTEHRRGEEVTNSSLVLCAIAQDMSDPHLRIKVTNRLDLAAGHAVVSAAGGKILLWPTLDPLRYCLNEPLQSDEVLVAGPILISSVTSKTDIWTDGIIYERRENDSKAEVIWHRTQVNQDMRAASLKQRPRCIWLTGLSGSGKSTIANSLELYLHNAGRHTFLLDGDNVRQGLNKDLGMSVEDRVENIRRVGEVARLMVDAGMIVVTAFISPFRADREEVRSLFPAGSFVEVFVDTPLEECERRDVKGLYAKARRGELKDFTGIDSSYEIPVSPDVHLYPGEKTIEECVKSLVQALDSSI